MAALRDLEGGEEVEEKKEEQPQEEVLEEEHDIPTPGRHLTSVHVCNRCCLFPWPS